MNSKYIIRISIVTFLSICAFVAAFIFYRQTNLIEKDLPGLHTEVQTLSIQASRVINLRQVATATGGDLEKLKAFFVGRDGALDFVQYIESLAVSAGLVFRIDTVDEFADSSLAPHDAVLLKLSVRTTGTLKRTRAFLSLIESLPYNVKIQRSDLRRVGNEWTLIIDIGVVKEIEK